MVEAQCGDTSSILRTSYVRIPDSSKTDTRGEEDVTQDLSLGLGNRPDSLDNVQESELPSSETLRPPNLGLGKVSGSTTPAHPNISDLSQVRQRPNEIVHHYWAIFLLVKNRLRDCREEDAISIFCNNCTDKGILNAISRRDITRFADWPSIARKYCSMKSAWKIEKKIGTIRP